MSNELKTIFFLPKLFGAFPFTFKENKARLSIPLVAYGLLLRVAFSFECYRSTVRLRENVFTYERNQFYFITLASSYILLYIFTSVNFAFLLLNARLFKWVLKCCVKVDKDLGGLGVDHTCGYSKFFDGLVVFIGLFPSLLSVVSFGELSLEKFLHWIFLFYLTINFFMGVYPFIRTVDFLRVRFDELGNVMSQLDGPEKDSKMIITVQLHNILCSVSKALNKCYNMQLLLFWFVDFVIIVTSCYFFVDGIIKNESTLMIFIKSLVIVFCCLIGYLITYVCKQASYEAEEFNMLLYRMMIDDNTSVISTNKKLRLHISMKREVVFTACGFFNLDYKLIHSIITASTTYLVVLIQFGQSKNVLSQLNKNTIHSPALGNVTGS